MANYYSTFTAGMEEAAERFILKDMPGSGIERMMPGAVLYKRRTAPTQPGWMNNTYLCLMTFGRLKGDPIREMVRLVCTRGLNADHLMTHMPAEAQSFRPLFVVDQLISHVGMKTLEAAEEYLTMATGLKCDRAKPDVEFWFVYKNEGYGFLLMRLGETKRDKSKPGELRTDTASLLCRLTEPAHGETFMDPFAGTGSIAGAALGYDFARIIASEGNHKNVSALNSRFSGVTRVRIVEDEDTLEKTESGSVDKIATVLPEVTADEQGRSALRKIAASLRRVMKKGGLFVAMTTTPRELSVALSMDFELVGRYDVTVAGREMGVLCARKK